MNAGNNRCLQGCVSIGPTHGHTSLALIARRPPPLERRPLSTSLLEPILSRRLFNPLTSPS
jgi:hypothetical protein